MIYHFGCTYLIFSIQINVNGFFKLILLFQMSVTRHLQITENNNFSIFLQYLKKEVSDEVDFLHADKYKNFIQADSMILMG